jgi:hypothetical protein
MKSPTALDLAIKEAKENVTREILIAVLEAKSLDEVKEYLEKSLES